MKDLSKYIESLIDDVGGEIEVQKKGNTYEIQITQGLKRYHRLTAKDFLRLTTRVRIGYILQIYFPNGDLTFEIIHKFV